MPKFVVFKSRSAKVNVAINPAMVSHLWADGKNTTGITVMGSRRSYVVVQGSFAQVAKRLDIELQVES